MNNSGSDGHEETGVGEGRDANSSNSGTGDSEDHDRTGASERSSHHKAGTVSEKEWIEIMNRADPFEQSLRARKQFNRIEPLAQSIKAYRKGTQYYLLNRGERLIERLRYRALKVDVNVRRARLSQLYEVRDLPPESFFQAGTMNLPGQQRMHFTLVLAQWENDHVFESESCDDERRLRLFSPTDPVPSLDRLDLAVVPVDPTPVGS